MTVTPPATCRSCAAPLTLTLVDLGTQPLANSYVPMGKAGMAEPKYPLHARVCESCWLVQVDDVVPANEIFDGDYAYFSSFSDSWLAHCRRYAQKMTGDLHLNGDSLVIEIASNDGYLLQYFKEAGVPVLGVEPSANTAREAERKGVPTLVEFWSEALAERLAEAGKRPDLICSANVLAHVPDINDFVRGIARLLTGDAVYTVEFPHLLNMIRHVQFDTIYHEHYSYLSLIAVEKIFADAGLRVFEVEELPTHGGSLRVYACLQGATHTERPGVCKVRADEKAAKFDSAEGYQGFTARVEAVRDGLRDFLQSAHVGGRTVAAYGAAAKGNTILNYCGVGADRIAYCVDRNPAKQNTLLPGSQIPVFDVEELRRRRPDFVLILPWNLQAEIIGQLADLRAKGTRFVTAIPSVSITT
ncbi:MAG: class I SAM-dependent methyltransferase [Paracoccaceae bacterium]